MKGVFFYPYIPEIREMLVNQKNSAIKNGYYHYTQVYFAYNSNHMEGSTLTEDQTATIFDKKVIEGNAKVADVIEMSNHFNLFDYMLDTIDEPLSEELILKYHSILKAGSDVDAGEYKKEANQIGIFNPIETTPVELVHAEMEQLLKLWNSKTEVTFEDVADFHARFESIHPFQDGNGRIGRIIMFKECLKNEIMPFIVFDTTKKYYSDGLNNWRKGNSVQLCQVLNECQEYYYQNTQYFLGNERSIAQPYSKDIQFNENSALDD